MKSQIQETVPLGELTLAVFDKAAQYSPDPREVSRLAMQILSHRSWRGRDQAISRSSLNASR